MKGTGAHGGAGRRGEEGPVKKTGGLGTGGRARVFVGKGARVSRKKWEIDRQSSRPPEEHIE